MRETSKLAYENAVRSGLLSKMRLLVYRAVCDYPEKTQNEYHKIISEIYERCPVNKPSITPIFAQLVKANWIEESEVRKCEISDQLCLTYQIIGCVGYKPSECKEISELQKLREENLELKKEIEYLKAKLYHKAKQMTFI